MFVERLRRRYDAPLARPAPKSFAIGVVASLKLETLSSRVGKTVLDGNAQLLPYNTKRSWVSPVKAITDALLLTYYSHTRLSTGV